jgi:phosphate-selective porin OprO/OprP
MDINKNPFCPVLSVLILAGLIFFSTRLFSEETKPTHIKSDTLSGRRVLPIKKRDKNRTKGDGDAKLKLGGVLMWDYDQFNGVHLGRAQEDYQVSNEIELRRARIDIKNKFKKDWEAELQLTFYDGTSAPDIGDAYIAFTGWDVIAFSIGQTKEPFGLEELTSSKNITLIERSIATNVFAPGHHPGLGLSLHRKPFIWAIGVYEAADHENKRDSYALTSRFVFIPWEHKNSVLHVGIAGSVRDFGGEAYKIEERAEVHTAEEIVRSVETQADEVQLLGLEFALVFGPFSLQAEHMSAMIKAPTGNDAAYAGYYIQGSYFLTGETRPYKKGTFKRIKSLNTYGALELMSRYTFLDAEDNNKGVRVSNITLGVNYYLNKRIRLMANYIKTNLIDGVSELEGKADAISFRMQYDF